MAPGTKQDLHIYSQVKRAVIPKALGEWSEIMEGDSVCFFLSLLEQELPYFFVKGQIADILDFAGHVDSDLT